ncbi:MAG: hypothetical protein IJ719_18095 [Clostridia bacterium]|nr:hypothetical protein [Clostridia bacterium]
MGTGGYYLELPTTREASVAMADVKAVADMNLREYRPPVSWKGQSNWSRDLERAGHILFVNSDTRFWQGEFGQGNEIDGTNLFEKICLALASSGDVSGFTGQCIYEDSVSGFSENIRVRFEKDEITFLFITADGPEGLCREAAHAGHAISRMDHPGKGALCSQYLFWCHPETCGQSCKANWFTERFRRNEKNAFERVE